MITDTEFENLINKNESTILDFKKKLYDFANDNNNVETSKFVKDVICFTNTIRTETSYVIFGVREKDNKEIELLGISNIIDDSILQEKIKDKVIPRPNFSFYAKTYNNMTFGILEFPLFRYEMPIMPSVSNLKGLTAGKVYYRNGTSNTEANAIDIIRINDWLKALPESRSKYGLRGKVSKHIRELTEAKLKLSTILSDLFLLAKEHNLIQLRDFCEQEIKGSDVKSVDDDNHRVISCFISWNKLDINPYSMFKATTQLVINELDEHKEFFKYKIALNYPIVKLEATMEKIGVAENSSYGTFKTDTQTLLGMKKKHTIYVYLFPEDYKSLYVNIRQKAIDMLMQL